MGAEAKKQRDAMAQRMPKDVIMSDKQRRMVESVLRGLSADALPANAASALTGDCAGSCKKSFEFGRQACSQILYSSFVHIFHVAMHLCTALVLLPTWQL